MGVAIEAARRASPEDQRRPRPLVGAAIAKNGESAVTFRGEHGPGEHAEYGLLKSLRWTPRAAVLYATLEPCVTRGHPKRPCADRIIENGGITHVAIGMLDPNLVRRNNSTGYLRVTSSPGGEFDAAAPFPIPQAWAMTAVRSVCESITDGDHLPPPKSADGVPFLVIGNVRSKRIDFAGSRFVPNEYYEALDRSRRPAAGDLLYTLVGSYGIPVVVRDSRPFCVQRHIGILRPSKEVDVFYLAYAMESQFVFLQASACATGIAQKTVPLSGLRRIMVPLPPLSEQRQIVQSLDKLMSVCEDFESKLAAATDVRAAPLEAMLCDAVSPWKCAANISQLPSDQGLANLGSP